jgi:hypothetical protein
VSDRLLRLLRDAASGNPPPAAGVVEVWPGRLGGTPPLELKPVADPAPGHLTPPGEPLFAQVTPGNAASLRVVEAAGFRPLGAEVLFHRDGAAS